MKNSFPWIVGGVGLGLAAYLMMRDAEASPVAGGASGGVRHVANRATIWGDKHRVMGAAAQALGAVKEGVGEALGEGGLAADGAVDHAAGTLLNATSKLADAAGKTLREMER